MRKALLILGIVLAVAALGCLLLSYISWRGYQGVLDGSPSLYARLLSRAKWFLGFGAGAALLSLLCFFLRGRVD